jgi:hypothetical protein
MITITPNHVTPLEPERLEAPDAEPAERSGSAFGQDTDDRGRDPVDLALIESFPASDPPSWWAGR